MASTRLMRIVAIVSLAAALLAFAPVAAAKGPAAPTGPQVRRYLVPPNGQPGGQRQVKPRDRVQQEGTAGAPAPLSQGILDQSQTSFFDGGGLSVDQVQIVGQVFTPELSGALSAARLQVGRCVQYDGSDQPLPVGDLIAEIRTVDPRTGLPTATVLSTALVPEADVWQGSIWNGSQYVAFDDSTWTTIQFAQPATVAAGTPYALLLRPAAPSDCNFFWSWGVGSGDLYPGGYLVSNFPSEPYADQWFRHDETDLAFQTYVTPLTPPEWIAGMKKQIRDMQLPHTVATSLTAKLDATLASIEKEHTGPACNQLAAFINQVEAQRGKALTPEQADLLISEAMATQSSLTCAR